MQYVTQLHSRSKQDSITHTFNIEEAINTDPTQPNIEPNMGVRNIESTKTPSIDTQNRPEEQNLLPQSQESLSPDPEFLSPDPAREIILRHSQDNQTKQPVNNNNNTTIQEEWIIPNKLLPDETWNLATNSKTQVQNKTQSSHDVNIAHQCKSILKATTPITSNIIENYQKRAYLAANHLAQELGYKTSKKYKAQQYCMTKEYRKLQPLIQQKANHNRKITFQIPNTKKPLHPPRELTETHLIFSLSNA